MKGRWTRVTYPLVFPFKLSYGTFHQRSSMIVELSQDGQKGYGELSFVPYYGKDEELIKNQLEQLLNYLSEVEGEWTPWDLYPEMANKFQPDSFLMSAVDCALYDLYGNLKNEPVWKLVGGEKEVPALSSLTITEDDWKEKLNWNWPVLKLKMGFDGDMELLQEIRKHYDGELRIDANSGWNLAAFQNRMDQLVTAGVALVEQPVPPEEDHELKGISCPIPLAADESVQEMNDLERIAEIYQVANIKLQKCGGISPALDMIRRCRELGLELMAGCMTESSVGIGAMTQLASYFDYLDLDGEHLIKADFGSRKFVQEGKVQLLDGGGLGQDFIISL